MTAGIRSFTNDNFVKYLPELAALGNAGFRAKVMGETITKFSISIASAATHYNHSLKQARINNPKSVAGLGRPRQKGWTQARDHRDGDQGEDWRSGG